MRHAAAACSRAAGEAHPRAEQSTLLLSQSDLAQALGVVRADWSLFE